MWTCTSIATQSSISEAKISPARTGTISRYLIYSGSPSSQEEPVRGLMQDVPLSISLILRRMMSVGAEMTVTSVEPAGVDIRRYSEIVDRSLRLASALEELGVPRGGNVASFAWNGHRHPALHYGAPDSRPVPHTADVRLPPGAAE